MAKKFMVASDLHGSNIALDKVLAIFEESGADKLILLGDIFGTGAEEMVEKLNQISGKLTIVKGNNDWYFEPENARFVILKEAYENINGKIAYLCHGHKLNDMYLEGYGARIVMIGHVHRPILQDNNGIVFMCPGSMAVPRFGTDKSYAMIDDKKIQILTQDGDLIDEINY
ncbi:MAG: YfcE family phosphodiesterase [Clostridia bacterium]|nr:YfcE family phosphodiesterase [Clostridia bacterium]